VGCRWCDTKYSWAAARGRQMTLEVLLDDVKSRGLDNVVVTGGEPLEHPTFALLIEGLASLRRRVEVETAGAEVPPPVVVDQWNVSLKLAHSGVPEARRLRPAAIDRFRELGAWFKFVVAEERDLHEVLQIQAQHALPSDRILLMPLGMRREEQQARMPQVIDWCGRYGFRFSPRLHILVWGPKRGV